MIPQIVPIVNRLYAMFFAVIPKASSDHIFCLLLRFEIYHRFASCLIHMRKRVNQTKSKNFNYFYEHRCKLAFKLIKSLVKVSRF